MEKVIKTGKNINNQNSLEKKVIRKFKEIFFKVLIAVLLASIFTGVILYFTSGIISPISGQEISFRSEMELLQRNTRDVGDWLVGGVTEAILNIAFGILYAIISIIWTIVDSIFEPMFNAMQDAIYILFSGEIIVQAFNLTYKSWIIISGIIFSVMIFVYLCFTLLIKHKSPKATFLRLMKSILVLLLAPILFSLLFMLFGWFGHLLNYSRFNDTSIYNIISKYTFDLVGTFQSDITNFAILILGFIVIVLVFKWFFEFAIALSIRSFELIFYGVIGLGLSSSAYMSDEGKRLNQYNSVMLTKIINAFLLILGYFVTIYFLPAINNSIMNGEFETHYSNVESVRLVLIYAITLSSFWMLKSLSTEWAFLISGDTKGALATQLNQAGNIASSTLAPIRQVKNTALAVSTKGASKVASKAQNSLKIASTIKGANDARKTKERTKSIDKFLATWDEKINKINSQGSEEQKEG